MGKKVLVVSSSFRKGGNSDLLADRFIEGARSAGHDADKICLRDLDLKFCRGCMYCQTHDGCVLRDDVNGLLEKVQFADVIAFATPVYYYSMAGQLKTFLDRLNPLYPRENRFRAVYLLATSAEDDRRAMDGTIKEVEGWAECFEGVTLGGVVYGTGADAIGEIRDKKAYDDAFEAGKNI